MPQDLHVARLDCLAPTAHASIAAVTDWSSPWVVLEWAAAALVVALIVPFLLPRGRGQRGGAARLILALAVGLALAAAGAASSEIDAPGRVLHLAAILALLCGLVGLVGLLLFEFVLPLLGTDVPSILRDVLQVGVAGLAAMVCLRLAGFDVLPLLTTSAVLTAIIGLALQAPIANLFGGLALQLDRTLGQGDWIQTGNHSGRIVEIGWRSTRIITREGDTLFLPNSALLSGEVLNLSRPTGAHRTSVRISVHDRHPPGAVRQQLVNAIRDVPGVLDFPPPDAVIADFADAAIVYEVRYWLTEFERDPSIAGEVRSRLWYASRRAGLDPPPPAIVMARSLEVDPTTRIENVARDRDVRMGLLRRVELLAPLEDAAREQLAARMQRLEFTAGEPIFDQGTTGDTLYVVDRGEVGVTVLFDGTTAEVARLGRGEIFGEGALLTGEPHVATCVARTEVTCYAIDRSSFETLLSEKPEIAEHLSGILARRQAELEQRLAGFSTAARGRVDAARRSHLLDRIRDLFGIT
jgi:small-conductance mechanosensitive channel/CRP-like cAMP-binding protein